MTYSNWTRLLLNSVLAEVDDEVRRILEPLLRQIVKTVIAFLHNEVSPTSSLRWVRSLWCAQSRQFPAIFRSRIA